MIDETGNFFATTYAPVPARPALARRRETPHGDGKMSDLDDSSERDPLFWWHGHGVRAAGLLVIIHVAALLLATICFAVGRPGLLSLFAFGSISFWHGWVWTPLTYGFVHSPREVLGFAWEMYLLWVFGAQVEQFFGRRIFLRLYAILWLLTPLLLLIASASFPTAAFGAANTHFAIFIAFATLYPGAQFFFGLTAKWIAFILVGVYSVQDISAQDPVDLALLWASIGTAWSFVRWERGEFSLPKFRLPRRRPKLRVLPCSTPVVSRPDKVVASGPIEDIDSLLDKIARSGINSLSASERARLERASADLKNTDR